MLRSLLPAKVFVLVVSVFEEAKLFRRCFGNESVRPARLDKLKHAVPGSLQRIYTRRNRASIKRLGRLCGNIRRVDFFRRKAFGSFPLGVNWAILHKT
jgi:hypothetical protein